MAVLTGPVPLQFQWDSSTAIVIPITTKAVPGLKNASGQLVAAVNAGATSLAVQLAEAAITGAAVRPFPSWVTSSGIFRLDAGPLAEVLTVSAVSISGTTATLTVSATVFAHAAGANLQIQEVVGAAAVSTFTFAPQQTPGTLNSRGIVLELLGLLDRAMREGSATVA